MLNARFRAVGALAAGILLLSALSACGGGGDASSKSGASVGKNTFIDGLVAQINKSKTVHMKIDGGSLFTADADVRYGASTQIKMAAGLGGSVQNIILADNTMYLQQSAGGKYTKITASDPTYGGVIKIFAGLGPRDAVAGMKPGITKIVKDGSATLDGTTVTKYKVDATTKGTSGVFQALAGSGVGPTKLVLEFYVDSADLVHQITTSISGQKVTLTLSKWGAPVTFAVPASKDIVGGT
jgi:hypothetical protein